MRSIMRVVPVRRSVCRAAECIHTGRTHLVQGLWRQLRRLEELRHFAGGQLPRGVRLAQAAQTRVIPLLVFSQGYETRHAGFLLHTRRGGRRVLLAHAGAPPGDRLRAHGSVHGAGGAPSRMWREQQLPVKAGVSARLGTGSSTPTAGCWGGRYRPPPHGGARAQEDAPL